MTSHVAAFDAVARDYDTWAGAPLARRLRAVVWRWLDRSFAPGDRVVDLGCGTGWDAIHLASRGVSVLATDVSAAMLGEAQRNIAAAGATDLVSLARSDLTDVGRHGWRARLPGASEAFDGACSDFGSVNVLEDRRRLARGLADAIRPGGRVVLVVMGPLCVWEVAWHILHGEPSVAVRRWRSGVLARVGDGSVRVWYPSPRRLREDFSPWFRLVAQRGLGVALPPTDLARVVERRPRLLAALGLLEDRIAVRPWSAWLADHYVAVFERG